MKKAYLQKEVEGGVQCQTCNHYCVLQEGEVGKCRVRKNNEGDIYSLNYGELTGLNIDPIEKKPLFHFHPTTKSLSIAAAGCSFACQHCQNWQISQNPSEAQILQEMTPEEVIKLAKRKDVSSISYTYTEPTVFLEYSLDIMKLAHQQGIKNVWVSNGFFSEQTLELISEYLDAINIDLKSFSNDFYKNICDGKLSPVLDTIERVHNKDIWMEITTLIIPNKNDENTNLREIAQFIAKLDSNIPWHLSKFSSQHSWKMNNVPDTPTQVIKEAYQIGKEQGLNYIYPGNIAGSKKQNTYCPNCNELIIKRDLFSAQKFDDTGQCPNCNQNIQLIQ